MASSGHALPLRSAICCAQLDGNINWTPGLHYLYHLGQPIVPDHEVSSATVKRAPRVWTALDLLLTSKTINEARDEARE